MLLHYSMSDPMTRKSYFVKVGTARN